MSLSSPLAPGKLTIAIEPDAAIHLADTLDQVGTMLEEEIQSGFAANTGHPGYVEDLEAQLRAVRHIGMVLGKEIPKFYPMLSRQERRNQELHEE